MELDTRKFDRVISRIIAIDQIPTIAWDEQTGEPYIVMVDTDKPLLDSIEEVAFYLRAVADKIDPDGVEYAEPTEVCPDCGTELPFSRVTEHDCPASHIDGPWNEEDRRNESELNSLENNMQA